MNRPDSQDNAPLFVLGRFPPPVDGQSMATERLASLLESAYRVIRLNTEPDDGVTASDTKFRPSRILYYARLRRRLRKALATHPAAPILWTSISPTPLGHWRDRLTILPAFGPAQKIIAVSHRATLDDMFVSRMTGGSAVKLAKRVDRFVFLSDAISDRCAAWIPAEKRSVIPNTIDDALLCSETDLRIKTAPGDPFRLLFFSNMMPEKGFGDVLEAAALLGDRVQVTFAGGWSSKDTELEFRTRIASMRMTTRVRMAGQISDRAKARALLMDADTLALPSRHPTEGQPLVVIEAMNAGTPVIATQQGGLVDMLEDGVSGLFVPARDPKAIAAAVDRLSNPSFWADLSRGARRRFLNCFHPEVVRKKWEELVDRA